MGSRTLADISTGPDWLLYVLLILFGIISALLLSGKGSWLIAGYNTTTKENKQKYNKKLLCRVVGGGMLLLTLMLLFMTIFENTLPASFALIFAIVAVLDAAAIVILCNTVCKKSN